MEFFKKYYPDVDFSKGEEVKVLCPFHDDTEPSASINTDKGLFHCLVCGEGGNEQQFLSKVNGISVLEASKVLQKLNESTSEWELGGHAELLANYDFIESVKSKLHLSESTIEELKLGIFTDDFGRPNLAIPVIYNGVVMDLRRYNLRGYPNVPKIMSDKGADAGFVIPFDIWKKADDPTYVFEGEKDMMLARELGINAITLTGGANAIPNEYVKNSFKDREIIICYDNDDAGRKGAEKLYLSIKDIAKSVKYVNIGDVVEENKEDFFDMIVKYGKDAMDFFLLDVHEFNIEEEDTRKYDTIKEALANNKIKKRLVSKVTVNSEFEDSYAVPESVVFTKTAETRKKTDIMLLNETKSWFIDKKNPQNLLELIEISARKHDVMNKIKEFLGIMQESNLETKITGYQTMYKTRISDTNTDGTSLTIDMYSFDKVVVGKKYEIEYRIYPHPTKNQKLIAIGDKVKAIDDLTNFKPNKEKLSQFKVDGDIKKRLDFLYQSAKHHVAPHLNYDIWLMDDLVFNSILEFDYGERVRGALDVFILGDTQVGKSETAQKLVELYEFGHFLSLKTSSTVGLIGGSNKVEGSFMNTVGAIPRQHKGLAVLEEFSGAKQDFIKTMTDIRSSGKLRLARVSGELEVDCRLRMISISNPINDEAGNPRHLSNFPNGIIPLMELIKSSEDIARYDAFLLVEKPDKVFNPFKNKLTGNMIPKELYEHKIMWVATRTPDDVEFSEDSDSYIWEKAQELNDMFESNFPLFGRTITSRKLARFSVALASLLVNTDESFQKVVVNKEIVDYVFEWLITLYDNPVFKLKEYKKEYESYSICTAKDVNEINKLYSRHATLLDFLSHQSDTSQSTMRSVSGLEGDKFSAIFNKLVALKMVKITGAHVYPTRKFIQAMLKVDKTFTVNTGEMTSADLDPEIF